MNKVKFLKGTFAGIEFAINGLVAESLPEVTDENKALYEEGVEMGVFAPSTETEGTYTLALEFTNVAIASVTPLSNEIALAVVTSTAEG